MRASQGDLTPAANAKGDAANGDELVKLVPTQPGLDRIDAAATEPASGGCEGGEPTSEEALKASAAGRRLPPPPMPVHAASPSAGPASFWGRGRTTRSGRPASCGDGAEDKPQSRRTPGRRLLRPAHARVSGAWRSGFTGLSGQASRVKLAETECTPQGGDVRDPMLLNPVVHEGACATIGADAATARLRKSSSSWCSCSRRRNCCSPYSSTIGACVQGVATGRVR